ncbi:MAG TPA: MlaD family protein [Pirellulales bacterium]|nr:MlaD family protein [Pirellulales bacterium]
MDERKMRYSLGAVAIFTIAAAVSMVGLIGRAPSLLHGTYPLYVKFRQAPGVSEATPVRKFGIRIGQVTEIGFAPDDSGALVMVQIDANRRLRKNETLRVNSSLLGDAVLEVVEMDEDENLRGEYHQPGDTLEGTVRSDPLQVISNMEGGLADAMSSIGRTSDEIGQLAQKVSDLLGGNEEQIVRIVDKMEKTMDQLGAAVSSTQDLMGDPALRENLRRTMTDMPEVLADAREAIGSLRTTLSGVDRNLANLEGFTRPLGDRGPQLVANLESSAAKLDRVLTDMSAFSESLNAPSGSLSQLINNPDVYQQLKSAAMNINELSKEMRPILRNIEVLTDKLARHPEALLRRSTGVKFSPSEMGVESLPPRGIFHK